MDKNGELHQAYEETVIELFMTEDLLQNFGWEQYFLITAWNPFSKKLSFAENQERNLSLGRDLLQSGASVTKALGRSVDWEWVEESFAVKNINLENVIRLAKKYEQNAIFEVSPNGRKIISCLS